MPAAQAPDAPGVKRSTKLLPLLFWGGVGLSPLAALLLLVGSGFLLQLAAVLALLVVVLIGLSIALRQSGDTVRGEVEELVYEEIDHVRADIRGDITHAARTTHGQLMERIGGLHETVDALRHQVDTMRAQLERAASQPLPAPHPTGSAAVPQGVLRHTETVQVTTKTMVVDPTEARSGTVYGAGPGPRPEIPQQRRPDRAERIPARPDERERPPRAPERGHDRPDRPERPERSDRSDRPERAERPERVGRSERSERGEWIERRDDRVRDDHREQQSWSEQLLHERMERAHSGDWPQTQPRGGADVERRGGRRRAHDPDDDGEVTGMRTTDRWASVHSDERGGRELRMGERRSAVHADETGTHVRIEDRWATVRHEEYYPEESQAGGHRAAIEERDDERRGGRHGSRHDERDDRDDDRFEAPRYGSGTESRLTESPRRSEARRERDRDRGTHDPEPTTGGHRRADAHWSQTSYEEARRDETGATRWSEVRRDRPALGGGPQALPASPAESASRWGEYSGESARRDEERVSRRSRSAEDDEEYGWNGGRDGDRGGRPAHPIVDFEGNDDRWR
ncbi:hypothetical protein AB0M46_13410 [Dactylosporangium sp. NPDC051485]|uniref:hypothetical protein n=1 Tax=Dactylosporangium sp. NPDC051485 TaxID=3154846 RepID=UPI0034185389